MQCAYVHMPNFSSGFPVAVRKARSGDKSKIRMAWPCAVIVNQQFNSRREHL